MSLQTTDTLRQLAYECQAPSFLALPIARHCTPTPRSAYLSQILPTATVQHDPPSSRCVTLRSAPVLLQTMELARWRPGPCLPRLHTPFQRQPARRPSPTPPMTVMRLQRRRVPMRPRVGGGFLYRALCRCQVLQQESRAALESRTDI